MSEWIVFSLHLEREGGRDIGQIRENQARRKTVYDLRIYKANTATDQRQVIRNVGVAPENATRRRSRPTVLAEHKSWSRHFLCASSISAKVSNASSPLNGRHDAGSHGIS